MKNWKTTLFGGVPGLGMIIDGISTKSWGNVAGGLGLLLVSIFAKDFTTTE